MNISLSIINYNDDRSIYYKLPLAELALPKLACNNIKAQ